MNNSKKNDLLEAAKELFGEYGYVETTFKKISEKAGVALGLLTHHYGNKEKLFLAAGLNVLENLLEILRNSSNSDSSGYESTIKFCEAYLNFSIDKNSNWLVLVRCSPYSDMKTTSDRDTMNELFKQVLTELEFNLKRGIEDKSIRNLPAAETAQIIISLLVGTNRTRVLTPYALPNLYEEAITFISRSIKA